MSTLFAILGGLGVFLYGLRIMSAGLQKIAGQRLRAILAGLTRNRFSGVLSGFLITSAIQSSSATTVLVVSFANAGLLTLYQCIGLIMGANIGTTVTGWLVALLGFKVKITAFALPIIGIGFPLSFLRSPRARQLSEVLVGFGLLFLGLKFLKDGVPDIGSSPETLAWMQSLTHYGFASTLLFVVVGTALTIIVQSSSATMAITLTMAAKGWIGFELAAAMVLGENIGTTITATLASIGANRNAKRAARFHTLFNIIGVLWMLPIMSVVLSGLKSTLGADTQTHLAAFHTLFNVTNTILLIAFTRQMHKVVMKLVPLTPEEKGEVPHLRYLDAGYLSTPDLAADEARRALGEMVGVCGKMFGEVSEIIAKPDQKLGDLVLDVKRQEVLTDDMEQEIVEFCSQLARRGPSDQVAHEIASYLDMANDIERIGDHCFNLILLAQRRYEKEYDIDDESQEAMAEMSAGVAELLAITEQILRNPEESLADAKPLEARINRLRDRGRKSHAKRMQDGEMQVRAGLVAIDMLNNMEKIGDYCWNVCTAVHAIAQRRSSD